jgi:segregation and condensation protein B
MDVVEDGQSPAVAEPVTDEAQGEQTESGLEPSMTDQAETDQALSDEVSMDEVMPDELQEGEDVLIAEAVSEPAPDSSESLALKAIIEAAIYITDEPLTPEQIATAVEQPLSVVQEILAQLATEYAAPGRGLAVRELAGGYKMSTKPEYHESIRRFVKRLQPPLKLSLAALETLAVIAYKQPITGPEILDIRGVQGAGVLKTLLDRRLIATAGRKNVLGKPMMYKTTREFLIQFGLDSLAELPTLKEFEELGRMALTDEEVSAAPETTSAAEAKGEATASEEPVPLKEPEEAQTESEPEGETPEEPSPVESADQTIASADEDHAEPHA